MLGSWPVRAEADNASMEERVKRWAREAQEEVSRETDEFDDPEEESDGATLSVAGRVREGGYGPVGGV